MSRSTSHHRKGPSVQVTSSPTPGHFGQILDSPSSFTSSPASSFGSSSVMPSPATVYSENLYQMASSQHHPGSSGAQQGSFVEFVRAQPKGTVRFRPFEDGLDAAAREAIKTFQIYPDGGIEEFCRHIPYASGKKDFYEKTGRESFEVFQYVYRVPGDEKEYHVMWDYNIGLVRMTPFFKCCKYSKTTPAKMLNLNPGLRDITHSITGGSIMAQGYWMPYSCAKAVCATFCYHIAGALIPIFGPDFPAECLPPQSQDFARMVIDPALVVEATRQTEHMRETYLRGLEDGSAPTSYHHVRNYHSLDTATSTPRQRGFDSRPPSVHRHVLPPLGIPYTRPVSVSSADHSPHLAPLNYAAPRHGGPLLPSPIEHDRLPPLLHVATPLSVTLPPLSNRGMYSHSPRSSRPASLAQSVHRRYLSIPSLRTSEDTLVMAKRPQYDVQPAPSSAPVLDPSSRRWETPVPALPAPTQHYRAEFQRGVADEEPQSSDQTRLESSYCYPSPPRKPYAQLYYSETEQSRPSLASEPEIKDEETYGIAQEQEPLTASREESQQTQPHTAIKRHTLRFRSRAVGSSASAAAWSALDVNAAELLVNFSVKVKSRKGAEGAGEGDSDDSSAANDDATQKPRFNGSIASLLCDDEAPRKKRRRS